MTRLYFGDGVARILFPLIQTAGVIALGIVLAGCGTALEDGYKPRVLGSSPEARKGYYASPFTDQAEAASHEGGGGSSAPALHAGGPRQ